MAELRTPPLPLVALVGHPEIHREVGLWASQVLRPPLVAIAVAEANEGVLTRLFGAKKAPKPHAMPEGILKGDWFLKQRQRRAAVALAFVERSQVEGDPSSWMRMLARLKAVREASGHRAAGIIVVVLQDGAGPPAPLTPDRVTGLCNNLGLEPKSLYPLCRATLAIQDKKELEAALAPLGRMVLEAASAYYAGAAAAIRQRTLDLTAALGSCPPEVGVATAFKLAVMSEFRQDWVGAVGQYQTAYSALKGVPLGQPQPSVQRHAEVTRCADVVHFKVMMLLLHQQRTAEALAQFRDHIATFGPMPGSFPPAAAASHYGWLARQYQTAAEMISGRVDETTLRSHPDCSPRLLQTTAAQLAVRRKAAAEAAAQLRSSSGAPLALDVANVKKGKFIGQVVLRLEGGGQRDLSDAEFCEWLEEEEARVPHDQQVLELLSTCMAALQEARQERGRAQLAALAAHQHMECSNLTAARRLLLQATHVYRRDRWPVLLLASLLQLRDCCQRLKLHKEALLHSLEVTALPHSLGEQQAEAVASAALASMLAGAGDRRSSILKTSTSPAPGSPGSAAAADGEAALAPGGSPTAQQQQQQQEGAAPAPPVLRYTVQHLDPGQAMRLASAPREDGGKTSMADVLLQHNQQDNGWLSCLTVAAGFQAGALAPSELRFCCAVHSHLPIPLPLAGASLQLRDERGAFSVHAVAGPPPPPPLQQQQQQEQQQQLVAGDAKPSRPELSDLLNDLSLGSAAGQKAAASLQHDGAVQTAQRQLQEQQGVSKPLKDASLPPGRWHHLYFPFVPRCAGPVAAEQLLLSLGTRASVSFALGSFPQRQSSLGGAPWPGGAAPFGAGAAVRLGVFGVQVAHVGPLPTLQAAALHLVHLVGEYAPVDISIAASHALSPPTLELAARLSSAAPDAASGVPRGGAAAAAPAAAAQLQQPPLTLLTVHDGKLKALPLEGGSLQLPAVEAGGAFTQRVWVLSGAPLGVQLTATLLCPAPVCVAVSLQFQDPFETVTRLFSETNVHSLVGPSPAYQSAATAAPSGGAPGADRQQQQLQRQPDDSGGAVPAPAAPPPVPLVIGQAAMAQVLVRAVQDAPLELLDVGLDVPPGSAIQLVNQLSDQLPDRPAPTGLGSGHVFLLHLLPTRLLPAPGGPVGRLKLRWRRREGAGAVAATVGAQRQGAAPPGEVVTSLELPRVTVAESVLTAHVISPPAATAGIAFAFHLQVNNFSTQQQDVSVAVQEAQGFLFGGDKAQTLSLAPRGEARLTWHLVAHAAGELPLPSVRVAVPKLGGSVMTQSPLIHVMPF